MSVRAMSAVWEKSAMKGAPLLLLLAIADHANDRGHDAYPSIGTLRKKVRLDERQVRRIIRLLEAFGELRTSIGTGPRGTNEYIVVVATGANPVPCEGDKMPPGHRGQDAPLRSDTATPPGQDAPPDISEGFGGTFSGPGGDILAPKGGHSYAPRSVQNHPVEPPMNHPAAAAAEEEPVSDVGFRDRFGTLVTAWGGHLDRTMSDEFEQIASDHTLDDIVAAIAQVRRTRKRCYPSELLRFLPEWHDPAAEPLTREPLRDGSLSGFNEATAVWSKALTSLEAEVNAHSFQTWLAKTRAIGFVDGNLVVEAPSAMVADWLDKRMRIVAERAVGQAMADVSGLWFVDAGTRQLVGVA